MDKKLILVQESGDNSRFSFSFLYSILGTKGVNIDQSPLLIRETEGRTFI